MNNNFQLGIAGYCYADLHQPLRLRDLHETFNATVRESDADLFAEFETLHSDMPAKQMSDLLVRMAPYVGQFVACLFDVEDVVAKQMEAIRDEVDTIFVYRRAVVSKLAAKFKHEDVNTWDAVKIKQDMDLLHKVAFPAVYGASDVERSVSSMAAQLVQLANHYQQVAKQPSGDYPDIDQKIADLRLKLGADVCAKVALAEALAQKSAADFIDKLLAIVYRWSYLARHDVELVELTKDWLSFKIPQKTDFAKLVEHQLKQRDGFNSWVGLEANRRRRVGFRLTDRRYQQRQIQYEVDHCIYCHERDTDSCSKGMREKRRVGFKENPIGVSLTGCPLGQKISEMNVLKKQGDNIGALALIMIDNPMCPGTGHRICNECMQGCIYQKTEPVNVPQIETNVLTDVLFMPWGFEIYSLLSRWNPLNVKRPYALPYNGKNVLVVGLGPAGYTLAHYLLNEGFGVVGIDAMKLEPLADKLVGGNDRFPQPVRDFSELYEELDKRMLAGFGGVAEYGITVRWDKNFLKVIYLNLLRRKSFSCHGGVRFGGTITIEEAWELGFDHVAIATGAGKPTIIGIKNNLMRGIRKASDFLMALQLTGAAKESSLANLQVRLPAGVIGGGLTALDTATEIMAYYPVQVAKLLRRYEHLVALRGENKVRSCYDEEELLILDESLAHGRSIVAERERAELAGEQPDFQSLLVEWGGVTMFYRKGIQDSPAYRQNHEEIREALNEGIQLVEGMNPNGAVADQYDALKAVTFDKLVSKENQWLSEGNTFDVPLRSLFIAAGTSPNTIYEQEHPYSLRMSGKFFQRYEPSWNGAEEPELIPMNDDTTPKVGKPAPLTSYHKNGKYVSFYGDNHPVYAGNVATAMASAKDGYPYINRLFQKELSSLDANKQKENDQALADFFKHLDDVLTAQVVAVNRLAPTIIEVIVRAPMQAMKFQPGQFYRVQNLESLAPVVGDTVLAAEGLALTGAWVDKDKGLISLIALEMGSSSRLCSLWKPGDTLVVMGVTGEATHIVREKTVMLVGGGLGNAVQFSIGKALRAAGNRVVYFAGYKKPTDVFKVKEIEAASDVTVWSVDIADNADIVKATRPQDKLFTGNIIEAMQAYATGQLGEVTIKLEDVDHMIVIGSDRMMEAVKDARFKQLKPYLKPNHTAIGSINSPMQCMMKGVCAQCLCKHIDPHTKEEYFVYSCYNQDQELDRVDFANLNARLRQNTVQEKLSNMWLDHLLERMQI